MKCKLSVECGIDWYKMNAFYFATSRLSIVSRNDTILVCNKAHDIFDHQFFPKTEKYVALFTGSDDSEIADKRNRLRKQIKANLIAAAASGKDLEGTLFILYSTSNFFSEQFEI